MNPKRSIMASWLAMLGIQSVGSIDSQHRLPAPKQYVAIGALWGILFIAAETRFARTASQLSWLVLLTASVVGPFGKRFVQFLTFVAQNFAIPVEATEGISPGQGQGQGPSGPASTQPSIYPA